MFNITFVVLTISRARFEQLESSISGLPCRAAVHIIEHRTAPGMYHKSVVQAFQRAMILSRQNIHGPVGFVEDDTFFSPRFCWAARRLFSTIGKDWEVVHMCPGFVWGRDDSRHKTDSLFSYRPQAVVRKAKNPPDRRFFRGAPHPKAWVGGPTAFVARTPAVWSHLIDTMNKSSTTPTDVILTGVALQRSATHYIARDPPLCKERDFGRSLRVEYNAGV